MPRTMEVSEPALIDAYPSLPVTRMAIEDMMSRCQDLVGILSEVVGDLNER